MPEIGTLISQVGLPIALVVFFVLRSKEREDNMLKDIRELQGFQRTTLIAIIERAHAAEERMCNALEKLDAIAERCAFETAKVKT